MTNWRAILTAITLSLIAAIDPTLACATERQQVCAKYQTSDGWSGSYKVNAVLASGSELNSATRSINYDPIEKYAVIFWGEHQASVIKLDYPWLSIDTEGTDQGGRMWNISPAYGLCF
ncbi:hypothetical protein [Burkholderia glumae]|uniref:hypothetical protein n=1 Tax=Burkholderia glumae TaxID=337 RepID=UPI00192A67FF|nr:hypothetical protein [Burkholderia glumae]